MTTYKEIKGDVVERVASDPTNPGEGDIWYNTTTGTLKGYQSIGAAWSSAPSLTVSHYQGAGSVNGTQTSSLAFGGEGPAVGGGGPVPTGTDEYDGSSWTSGGALGTGRRTLGGCGTQAAALGYGGEYNGLPSGLNVTEEYDGASWTAGGNLNTTRRYFGGGAGYQTSGLAFAGYAAYPGSPVTATEEYNGTSWTNSNPVNVSNHSRGGCGTQTAALAIGGSGADATATEEYDGTSWSAGGALSAGRYSTGGMGTQTSSLAVSGIGTPDPTVVEQYNGTAWTSFASLGVGQQGGKANGSITSAIVYAGGPPTSLLSSQELDDPSFATQTLTTS
jgi:hypothetical protein